MGFASIDMSLEVKGRNNKEHSVGDGPRKAKMRWHCAEPSTEVNAPLARNVV